MRAAQALLDSAATNAQLALVSPTHSTSRGQLVAGQPYTFVTNGAILVECVAFATESPATQQLTLTDARGCSADQRIVRANNDSSSLVLVEAFRFPAAATDAATASQARAARVTFQCARVLCSAADSASCPPLCSAAAASLAASAQRQLVSSTYRVVDHVDCAAERVRSDWLLALLILVCVLLLVMMCVNCFLCSSLSCTCTRMTRDSDDDDDRDDTGAAAGGRDSYYDA